MWAIAAQSLIKAPSHHNKFKEQNKQIHLSPNEQRQKVTKPDAHAVLLHFVLKYDYRQLDLQCF